MSGVYRFSAEQVERAGQLYAQLAETPFLSAVDLRSRLGWNSTVFEGAWGFLQRLGAVLVEDKKHGCYLRESFHFQKALLTYLGVNRPLFQGGFEDGLLMQALELLRKQLLTRRAAKRSYTLTDLEKILQNAGFSGSALRVEFLRLLVSYLQKDGLQVSDGRVSVDTPDRLPVSVLTRYGVTATALYLLQRNGLNSLGQVWGQLQGSGLCVLDKGLKRYETKLREVLTDFYREAI